MSNPADPYLQLRSLFKTIQGFDQGRAVGPTLETANVFEADDVNAIISQIRRIIYGLLPDVGEDWTDAPGLLGLVEIELLLASLQASVATLLPLTLVAGETITTGDTVTLNAAGKAVLATASTVADRWRVSAVALEAALVDETFAATKPGTLAPARFTSAPSGVLNGEKVYLSASLGLLQMGAPNTPGTTNYVAGQLAGGDGINPSPTILFLPQEEMENH